jgi:hypothetical protein
MFKEGKAPLFMNGKHPRVARHCRFKVEVGEAG